MNSYIKNNTNSKYPIWCWVKCYNSICPPKHKGEPVEGFDVKITFNKKKENIFITDFKRYSFLLKNNYIPNTMKDKIYLEICKQINKSFDKCITENSNILQGCVWNIKLDEIEKIEILPKDGYRYSSLNYIRKNGKRID